MLVLQFANAIESAGLVAPAHINADGQIHRFSSSGKRNDNAGWYVLHSNGLPAGVFGCWRMGVQQSWCSKPLQELNAIERAFLRHMTKQAQTLRLQAQQQRRLTAIQRAHKRWAAAKPTNQHPYTTSKRIPPINLRIDEVGNLLVPMYDTSGALLNLQTIAADGRKLFLQGGQVLGCFHLIGTSTEAMVVCEGFATAISIHVCTGLAVAAAFSCGNLSSVAKALHQAYPHLHLLVAADDDYNTEGNPGVTAARAAALSVGGSVVVPHFPSNRPIKATDFNDLYALAGAEAVRMCFAEVWEGSIHAV